ncbi:MAG: hypothetical protein ER33_08260 [Cyanobium sp. CACIAM 14]|nr:MAG: hypothetical protein ER33_08260 [Cyanobium sp. CACIAM 14]
MKVSLPLLLAPLLLVPLAIAPARAQVGVSIQMGQPGFYGQLNLGPGFPSPQLLYTQPVIVERPWGSVGQPIYLRVPPGHARNWAKHCARYGACGRPVYFVRDDWYENVYVPRYRNLYLDPTGKAVPYPVYSYPGYPYPGSPYPARKSKGMKYERD